VPIVNWGQLAAGDGVCGRLQLPCVGSVDVDGCTAVAVEGALQALVALVLLEGSPEGAAGCGGESGSTLTPR
jgi:hypothetical protein